ncbi:MULTISPECIES: DUF2947 domain-containing protein [Shewanella]|uniref:DUF2947 domain-containing protein n=1 Tax=Shewanella frigidimarina (strain NCIMB 400) TaxID=318167 RepID=Q085Q8_SHEFN|nr:MULTISPECIES: DUF2947 domain-containing protein [Shewanella]ABI71007.1 conserved hypothetical protein [Shewanella frigidimarina NCIMB 400]MBB1361926.1 DUF2947 domain-containing protein [Shewanella sp. SR44-4]MBB1428511.1 DUF2947 domain-containing protein [Shewanella sp. SG44-2]PKH33224.1 DUF2947 domain-containing protein [Shewanella sp. ALD9]RPA30826.1 DUF2947 family protein [Shewanella frigidimarina]
MSHSYIPFDLYKRKWIFNHKDLPVSDDDKALIKPLTDKSAMEVWDKWISNKSSRAELFEKGDWPIKQDAWAATEHWQSAWDSNDNAMPEAIIAHIQWPDDAVVYFCYEKYQIVETRWDVFVRNWKCFLFFDDGPILISPKHKQALMFLQNGQYKLGVRG